MSRYIYPYTTKSTSGHSSQTIWNKFRAFSSFSAERGGDTDSVMNLIPAEKVVPVKTPRILRTGGNPDMCFGSCCRG